MACDKIIVRFKGREFQYWNSCGFTEKRRNARRFTSDYEITTQRNRMNRSKDFPFKVSTVDYHSKARL